MFCLFSLFLWQFPYLWVLLLLHLFADSFPEAEMGILNRRPLCNNNSQSAPHINGKCFILCWRCIGVLTGVLTVSVLRLWFDVSIEENDLLYSIVMILPAYVDYVLIRCRLIRPNNIRRFFTGVLLGVPFAQVILLLIYGWILSKYNGLPFMFFRYVDKFLRSNFFLYK